MVFYKMRDFGSAGRPPPSLQPLRPLEGSKDPSPKVPRPVSKDFTIHGKQLLTIRIFNWIFQPAFHFLSAKAIFGTAQPGMHFFHSSVACFSGSFNRAIQFFTNTIK